METRITQKRFFIFLSLLVITPFLIISTGYSADRDYFVDSKNRIQKTTLPSDIIEDEFFSTDSGYDLDQYLFKDHKGIITGEEGMLEFYIEIDRYCGPVDDTGLDKSIYPDGGLLKKVSLLRTMGANVRLRMDVYDVDDDYSGTAVEPELDEVYVNGKKMAKNLSSGDSKWKMYEVEVPLDLLIFPEKGDKSTGIKPAKNLIQIKIDVGNRTNPDIVWAVEIDWAYFQFYSFPRPVVFIHGKGDNSLSWKIFKSNGYNDIDSGGWYKWFEEQGFVVGAVDVWSEGDPFYAMSQAHPDTDGDWLDNNGSGKWETPVGNTPWYVTVDESGEQNVAHTTSKPWHEIPEGNNLCFSDMLDTTTDSDTTVYMNMRGMRYISKMYGIKKVHFVSHSTGCFYGRKYISAVMSNEKDTPKQGYEDYPVVNKFIMIAAPNHGQDPKTFVGSLYKSWSKLGWNSPCTLFYTRNKWKDFNQNDKQNTYVNYYYVGGYSGWKDADDIPDPLRPYWDMGDWDPEYGDDWLNPVDTASLIKTAYKGLGGKVDEDWPDETAYSCSGWSLCYSPIMGWYPCQVTKTCTHIPNDGLATIKGAHLGYGEYLPYGEKKGKFSLNHHTIRTNSDVRYSIKEALLPEKTTSNIMQYQSKLFSKKETRKFISQNPPNVPETIKQYTYRTDTIDSSTTKSEEMMILGGSAIIHLIWDPSAGNLSIEATDPNGTVLDASEIAENPGDITIIPSSFVGGVWNFQITSGSLTQSTDYKLLAYMYNCDLQLKPSTEKYNYVMGEAVTLTVEFSSKEGNVTSAALTANIYLVEDDTLLGQIALYDDGSHGDATAGDGKYTSNEWMTAQKGKERFEITAVISQDENPFYKQAADIMINVIDNAVTFNGSNSDAGVDTDGNGLYEYLLVNVGVTSTATGEHTIAAELFDGDNNFISSFNGDATLINGANTIALNFDGKGIFSHGANGPYHLKNAVISTEGGEIRALQEDVHTTGPYGYTDFERPKIFFSGTQSDDGVDDDGDGQYDYLKWDFNITVSVAGTYNISATLKTGGYRDIEIVNDSQQLNAGENAWSLDFDGKKIRQNLVNGPYIVGDVSITGGGFTIYAGNVHTTNSYKYTDFESIETVDLSVYSDNIVFESSGSDRIIINVTINNAGLSTSDNFKVEIYRGPKSEGLLIGEDIVEGLNQDQTKIVEVNWDISGLPKTIYTIYVYANDNKLIGEYDYTNNMALKDADLTEFSQQEILLGTGWNLISIYRQPADASIGTVLDDISSKYSNAWAFQNNSWKVYDPANPGFSDLATMETGWGYWLNMTEAATLTVTGTVPSKSVALIAGWNLVGYSSSTEQAVADALTPINGKYVSVWAFVSGAWKVYHPANPGFSDLTTMEQGYGYWINATEACTWTLP